MKTVCKKNQCNGCMACIEKCPQNCISIYDSIESYNAVIDENKCINCKLCEKNCPNNKQVIKRPPQKWYQGWAEEDIRNNSSSGGIAFAIMKKFVLSGGYIASCLFENGDFKFSITNNLEDLKKFSGSKYVKSNPAGIYKEIEEKLLNYKVLFIGLPCQVASLKNIIKNQENLYTIDLICHGTPSPLLLRKYLKEENIDLDLISDIKFRTKTDFGLVINGKKLKQPRVCDEYTSCFLEAISYTENCYSCNYATLERVSDITLGDSWGTELKQEKIKGISLILIQSEKGQELLNTSNLVLREVDLNNAIKNNHQLSYPSHLSNKRKKFFKLINNGKSFKYAAFIVLPQVIIKQKIKKLLIKINLKKNRGRL